MEIWLFGDGVLTNCCNYKFKAGKLVIWSNTDMWKNKVWYYLRSWLHWISWRNYGGILCGTGLCPRTLRDIQHRQWPMVPTLPHCFASLTQGNAFDLPVSEPEPMRRKVIQLRMASTKIITLLKVRLFGIARNGTWSQSHQTSYSQSKGYHEVNGTYHSPAHQPPAAELQVDLKQKRLGFRDSAVAVLSLFCWHWTPLVVEAANHGKSLSQAFWFLLLSVQRFARRNPWKHWTRLNNWHFTCLDTVA